MFAIIVMLTTRKNAINLDKNEKQLTKNASGGPIYCDYHKPSDDQEQLRK